MSKTIYYLGAGASFGKRSNLGNILEGMPVVSEIPSQINDFRDYIDQAVVPPEGAIFQGFYNVQAVDIENAKY